MSIFTKAVSELGTEDVQELLQDGALENVRLEFKLEVPSKDETLKKLSSFGNTFGGFMVVGAKANSVDGRIKDLPGVDVESSYKQKVVDWCFAGVHPPLTVEVSDPIPVPAGTGKVCYVVYAAESDVAPHFLNGRKGVYVRTDEFSARFEERLANENELRHLFDRRKLIQERRVGLLDRARRRFSTYAERKYSEVSAQGEKFGSRLELCVAPRFPARPVCEHCKLAPLVGQNLVEWRQGNFPTISNGVVSQHESAIILQAAEGFSIFEANVWGMLFYGTEIDRDSRGNRGIHLPHLVGCVLLFIQHAGRLLQALGYSGPIAIDTALVSILGVQWLHFPHLSFTSTRAGSELDDDVTFSITTTGDALRDNSDCVAMDVLRYVFFGVNWPDLVDTPQKLETLVRQGYKYNYWPPPANLPDHR